MPIERPTHRKLKFNLTIGIPIRYEVSRECAFRKLKITPMKHNHILASLAALTFVSQACAAIFVTSSGSTTGGTSAGIANGSALMFTATSSVSVTDLGVFAPFVGNFPTLTVTLWKQGVVAPIATADISGGTRESNFIYASVSGSLVAGANYALAVTGYNGTVSFGDTAHADSAPVYSAAIGTFNHNYEYTGGVGTNPWASFTTDLGEARLTTASFKTAAVPEPEVYATVAGLMLVGFGLYRRQVSK
jgi:hypothetical protein